jgi:hypothetical protein
MAEMTFVKSTNSAALVAEAAKRCGFFCRFVRGSSPGCFAAGKR